MSFKIKNAQSIIKPAHKTITILFQAFPLFPYLLAGEMTEFLILNRSKITGEVMALQMFASFCANRLTAAERTLEFQSIEPSDTGEAIIKTTVFDLGLLEDLQRLPLAPEELLEVVTGSLALLNAGLGTDKPEEVEEGKLTVPTVIEKSTLDVTSPSSPITTALPPNVSAEPLGLPLSNS